METAPTNLLPTSTTAPASPRLVDQLEPLAQELADLLAPFRQSRLRGHYALRLLLEDPESRLLLQAQMQALSDYCAQLYPRYLAYHREVEDWRTNWDTASPDWKQWMSSVHHPVLASSLLNGLRLLVDEAHGDLEQLDKYVATTAPLLPTTSLTPSTR